MAVDSRDKRVSASNLSFITKYPQPDSEISSGDRMMAGGEYLIHPWVSATGYNSAEGWDDPENAYDGNTGTFAGEQVGAQTPLELEWDSGIWTDMIRIYAHDEDIIEETHDASDVKIDVWINGAWSELGASFTLPEDQWYEYPIGQKIVGDKVQIISRDTEEYLHVAGVQFLNLAETMPDSIIPKVGGGLVRNSLLGSGLVT